MNDPDNNLAPRAAILVSVAAFVLALGVVVIDIMNGGAA